MVFSEVVDDIISTSGHLECASMTRRNVSPRNGPAKSTCMQFQGVYDYYL